jgi:hypothetical protein
MFLDLKKGFTAIFFENQGLVFSLTYFFKKKFLLPHLYFLLTLLRPLKDTQGNFCTVYSYQFLAVKFFIASLSNLRRGNTEKWWTCLKEDGNEK